MIKFEYDLAKAADNLKMHNVSFYEAKSLFYDVFAVQFYDDENSEIEERFLLLGLSSEAKLLLVCHCERESGNTIRLISARKATRSESKYYKGAKL